MYCKTIRNSRFPKSHDVLRAGAGARSAIFLMKTPPLLLKIPGPEARIFTPLESLRETNEIVLTLHMFYNTFLSARLLLNFSLT